MMLPIFNLTARRAAAVSSNSTSSFATFPQSFLPRLISTVPSTSSLPFSAPQRSFASVPAPRPRSFESEEADFDSTAFHPRSTSSPQSQQQRQQQSQIFDPTSLFSTTPKPVSHPFSSPTPLTSIPTPRTPSSSSSSVSPSVSSSPDSSSSVSLDPSSYPMDPLLRQSLISNFSISTLYPIQAECYLPITQGRDLIGRSKTGTGKTLAFILPLLQRLKSERISPRPFDMSILILEPTRELARQVTGEIKKLNSNVRVATVYGGVGYLEQFATLKAGVDICVGTPGRLMDLIDRGACSFKATQIVVLDEADEMLKMGFKKEIDVVLSQVNRRQKAQVLLFSATLPHWVQEVSETFQSNAVVVDKVTGEDNATPPLIDHVAILPLV